MGTSQLKENPLVAHCIFIDRWSYDRDMLEGVIRAEEVVVDGRTLYNPFRAYCSMARDKPEYFHEACPNWLECPYVKGETHDVKPKTAE